MGRIGNMRSFLMSYARGADRGQSALLSAAVEN
jgi:hypothetical protein